MKQYNPLFYILWAINGPLEEVELEKQLYNFKSYGFDGVVFHPRFYTQEPKYLCDTYFAILSKCILQAKALGLKFWIYDEDGWPSGTVGGELLTAHPEDRQLFINLDSLQNQDCLMTFFEDGESWCLNVKEGPGVNYLSPVFTQHFIDMTHERYRHGLSSEAFEYVSAIFSDEPELGLGHAFEHGLSKHGSIPWSHDLPEKYEKIFGEPLIPLLKYCFFDGPDSLSFRIRFREFLTEVFCESFLTPINTWCKKYNLDFTAHVKGEEDPLFQAFMVGSCSRVYKNISLPGIDALERMPSNDFYPLQLSSSARQFGNGRCMSESFGGAGWGARPEDFERYIMWLGKSGVTDFVIHLGQYELNTQAIRDWPTSQPMHLTWKNLYAELLTKLKRRLTKEFRPVADTLMVIPMRKIMASLQPKELHRMNIHNGESYDMTIAGSLNREFMDQVDQYLAEGINFDVTDEKTLEDEAIFYNGRIALGNAQYKYIIYSSDTILSSAVRDKCHDMKLSHKSYQETSKETHQPSISLPDQKAEGKLIKTEWQVVDKVNNSMLLEGELQEGIVSAQFYVAEELQDNIIEVLVTDVVSKAWINGLPIELKHQNGQSTMSVNLYFKKWHKIDLMMDNKNEVPMIWINGVFGVKSLSPYIEAIEKHWSTEGPFVIMEQQKIVSDLVLDGFPFLYHSIKLSSSVTTELKNCSISFEGVTVDALRIEGAKTCTPWTWKEPWNIQLEYDENTAKQKIQIQVIPNGYNHYGPHHYYRGDTNLVSPAQFSGIKNFADHSDAPEKTHVKLWHFLKQGCPSSFRILNSTSSINPWLISR